MASCSLLKALSASDLGLMEYQVSWPQKSYITAKWSIEEFAHRMLFTDLIKCQQCWYNGSFESRKVSSVCYIWKEYNEFGLLFTETWKKSSLFVLHFSFPITGKTTLTESLRDTLGATLLLSPPQCLSPFRARFDQEPPLIRRAFYALGNYITAEQVVQEGMKAPVIVDR